MSSGYYKMHRGWMDNPLFKDEPYSEQMAWCYLIEKAAWDNTNMAGVDIERGQLFVSERYLASAWGWSKKKVRLFLERTTKRTMTTIIRERKGTTIIINNYKKYQDNSPPPVEKGTTKEPLTTEKGTTKRTKYKEYNINTNKINNYNDDFLLFYSAYPKKTNKRAAERKFLQCVGRGVRVDEILRGAKNYAAWCKSEKQPARYIQAPDVWLNKGRWEDELEVTPKTLTEGNEIDWEKERDW